MVRCTSTLIILWEATKSVRDAQATCWIHRLITSRVRDIIMFSATSHATDEVTRENT